jgi:protease I
MSRIAVLVANDFEDTELAYPVDKLREVGHVVEVLGAHAHEVLDGKRRQERVIVDAAFHDRDPASYDAVVIPGGYSPDKLRMDPDAVKFVRDFARTDRPLAAICHGPQLLIEANLVDGKRLTSWPSVRKDLENAHAMWTDAEVVVDGNLITSRNPGDVPAFTREILRQLAVPKAA